MRAAFGSTANSKEQPIMPTKRLIDVRRMRKGLPRGFGWIDHRLLQEGYITNCTPQALALYVLLVCASDAQGLSYYSGPRIAELLRLEPEGRLRSAPGIDRVGTDRLPKTPLSAPESGKSTAGDQKPAYTTDLVGLRAPTNWCY
jgi:hypothetical protein